MQRRKSHEMISHLEFAKTKEQFKRIKTSQPIPSSFTQKIAIVFSLHVQAIALL